MCRLKPAHFFCIAGFLLGDSSLRFLQQGFSCPEDIAGAHGQDHVPFFYDPPKALGHLRQGLAADRAGDPCRQIGRGDSAGVPFPGRVDLRQDQDIRLFQLPDKVFKQRFGYFF